MKKIPTSFGIYGTCVSIDVFNINKSSQIVAAKNPVRATSIFTLDSRLNRGGVEFEHPSSWFTEMLGHVFDGNVKSCLKHERGEYLIIDLIEERFKFLVVNDDTLFLNSSYCQQANVIQKLKENGYKISEADHENLSYNEIQRYIKNFAEYITTIYPQKKIIINEAYLVDKYRDVDGKIKEFQGEWNNYIIEKSKRYFKYFYESLKECLPNAYVIQMPEWNVADAKHYHLNSPAHFIPKAYEYVYEKIRDYVLQDYETQRQIPLCEYVTGKTSRYTIKELSEIGVPEEWVSWYVEIGRKTTLEGKIVLQVGGTPVPKAATRKLQVKKWIYLTGESNGNGKQFWDFKEKYINPRMLLRTNNYIMYQGKIEDLTFDFTDLFDVILSRAQIETIKDINIYLDNIYKVLNDNGEYFERAGRIWSSSVGSKWRINGNHNCMNIQDMPLYPHLLMSYEEILEYLNEKYKYKFGEKNVYSLSDRENFAEEVKNGLGNLNKYFYEDYEEYVKKSLFQVKMIRPIFGEKIDKEMEEKLRFLYKPYKVFNYKSLEIYCQKRLME